MTLQALRQAIWGHIWKHTVEKSSKGFLGVTWSGPKMRSPRVPFSPMSMPLAICSTLVLAAATFPFTLSASWLGRLLLTQVFLTGFSWFKNVLDNPSNTWVVGLLLQLLVLPREAMMLSTWVFVNYWIMDLMVFNTQIIHDSGILTWPVVPACSPLSTRTPPAWRWSAEQKRLIWGARRVGSVFSKQIRSSLETYLVRILAPPAASCLSCFLFEAATDTDTNMDTNTDTNIYTNA